ncbi:hypothetical protein [Eggerthia catenaformis]|uniref:hypothetical protein n=1 Tax=Eggerthia catenaformis TaxID=31973 RepID=UPI00248DD7AF|nr:hypothetical protein [Eggerthia catenaformis]
MRVEVFPLEKITIDNKEIMLGMNINEVQKLIGIPDRVFSNCDGESGGHYYFDSELRLDFDESGLLEFIEFLGGIDGNLRPYLYGVSAFETSADELLKMIIEQDDEVDDSEADYCYCFLNISIGLWRQDNQNKHWDTIGIGVDKYYRYE